MFAGLWKTIEREDAIEFYNRFVNHAMATGTKVSLSLNEYLALVFKEETKGSTFDNDTDKKLEEFALQKLAEMKKTHG